MYGILLTQNDGAILGPISKLLGFLMEGIFNVLDLIGIPNIGLSIIIFTIAIYLLLMPLTIKQQKFSKLSAKMNPELQAIQAKYKNKKDNESMMAMNQETQAVYAKYGVSPSGSCVQLLIQMPILFSLYRVIYAMPAYVGKIKAVFLPLTEKILSKDGGNFLLNPKVADEDVIKSINQTVSMYGKSFTEGVTEGDKVNGLIDILNRLSTSDLEAIAKEYDLTQLKFYSEEVISISEKYNFTNLVNINFERYEDELIILGKNNLIDKFNTFLGINMGNSPWYTIQESFDKIKDSIIDNVSSEGAWFILIGALLIPVLSALTQWINTKLMPQASNNGNSGNETADAMAQSMKTMNVMMPIMSAFFCFTLPAGMGLYWIAGSVVRSIQQIVINKYFDRMDMDEMIKKNEEKYKEKMEKAGVMASGLNNYASMNTKSISSKASMTQSEKEEALKKANEYYSKNAKPGSIAAKANMVKEYNEKNNK